MIRLQLEGASILGDRSIGTADIAQCVAQIAHRVRHVGLQSDRPAQGRYRVFTLAEATQNQSALVMRIRPFRLRARNGGQNLQRDVGIAEEPMRGAQQQARRACGSPAV